MDAKRMLESGKNNRVVNGIKNYKEVKESENGDFVIIKTKEKIVDYPQDCSFSIMSRHVCIQMLIENVVLFQTLLPQVASV